MATPGRPLPPDDRSRIERLARHGMSLRAIAREVDVSRNTVRKIVRCKVTRP